MENRSDESILSSFRRAKGMRLGSTNRKLGVPRRRVRKARSSGFCHVMGAT